jgi:hypothetical protein
MWTNLNSLYIPLQIAVFVLFLIALYRSSRVGRARVLELLTAVIFGSLLEEGDILIFKTYRYSEHWLLIDHVPVAFALCWALIVFSAMNLTERAWHRRTCAIGRAMGGSA